MGFSQMGHLVKLNIRNYIISQNDQRSLIKWNILYLLHTYFLPTYPPTYLDVLPTYPSNYNVPTY